MSASCSGGGCATESGLNDPRWRRALWIALVINAGMFAIELVAGVSADSRALMADALDFLGDAANYAISLVVAGMALVWRARAALLKGVTLIALGLWVLGSTAYAAVLGASPHAGTMGLIGVLALVANVGVASMLYRFRSGDANMRSAWICTRNDVLGNIAVMLAALAVQGAAVVIRQSRAELRFAAAPAE